MKIKWVDKVKNGKSFSYGTGKRSLRNRIRSRRDRVVDHILRHEELVRTILERMISDQRGRGKRRLEYNSQIIENVGYYSYLEMKRFCSK